MNQKLIWPILFLVLWAMPLRAQETEIFFTSAWSQDGQYIGLSYKSGVVEIQDVTTQKIIQRFDSGHTDGAVLAWSPDGQRLVTGGWGSDQGVKIWDVAVGKTVAVFEHLGSGFNQIAWDATGTKFIVSSLEGKSFAWSVNRETDTYTITYEFLSPSTNTLNWSPDNTSFLLSARSAYIYDATTYDITVTCNLSPGADAAASVPTIFNAAWHPDGQSIACGTDNGRITIWDIEGNPLYEVAGTSVVSEFYDFYGKWVSHLSFNDEGTQLMSIAGMGVIRIWETDTYTLLHETVLPGGPFDGFSVSPDRSRILVVDQKSNFTIIETPDLTVEGLPSTPLALSTSEPD